MPAVARPVSLVISLSPRLSASQHTASRQQALPHSFWFRMSICFSAMEDIPVTPLTVPDRAMYYESRSRDRRSRNPSEPFPVTSTPNRNDGLINRLSGKQHPKNHDSSLPSIMSPFRRVPLQLPLFFSVFPLHISPLERVRLEQAVQAAAASHTGEQRSQAGLV